MQSKKKMGLTYAVRAEASPIACEGEMTDTSHNQIISRKRKFVKKNLLTADDVFEMRCRRYMKMEKFKRILALVGIAVCVTAIILSACTIVDIFMMGGAI